MKPLDRILTDVRDGDIVLVHLERSSFVGYRWGNGRDIIVHEAGRRVLQSEREGYLKNARESLLNPEESDVVFCGFNGFGYLGEEALKKVQLVGINLTSKTMNGVRVLGYDILHRSEGEDQFDTHKF